jgi:large subunit ribosomal protein L11
MSKQIKGYLKLQIKGALANPSPPIGPALGSKGLNIMEFCKKFNAITKDKKGDVLPVVITIYKDNSFDFIIKTPPTSVLIMNMIKIKKGSKEANRNKVGTISLEQIKKIAEIKIVDLNTLKIDSAIKMVVGTAKSIGITVK